MDKIDYSKFYLILNEKEIFIKKFVRQLDSFNKDMKNKKKWCIHYWTTNEGYTRINDFLCRKRSNTNNYNKISKIYKLFSEKIKEDDEKLNEIVEIIKSQMTVEKKPYVIKKFYRGDDTIPLTNLHLETFVSVSKEKDNAWDFGKVFTIIIDHDVKRLDVSKIFLYGKYDELNEYEVLIEDGCYWEIIQNNKTEIIVNIHSPNKPYNYSWRNELITIAQEEKNINSIIILGNIIDVFINLTFQHYIQQFFIEFFNNYFTQKKIVSNIIKKYKNYIKINNFIGKIEDLLRTKDIKNVVFYNNFLDEEHLFIFIKDIYLQNKAKYREIIKNYYIPKFKLLHSKKNISSKNKTIRKSKIIK